MATHRDRKVGKKGVFGLAGAARTELAPPSFAMAWFRARCRL